MNVFQKLFVQHRIAVLALPVMYHTKKYTKDALGDYFYILFVSQIPNKN